MSTTPPQDSDSWHQPEERTDYRDIASTGSSTRSERRIYPHADPGKRLVAGIIDSIIVSIVWAVTLVIGQGIGLGDWSFILTLICQVGFYVYFWASTGATPGKSFMKIRVVDTDYQIISEGKAIVRYIGYSVSSIVFMLGYIWIFIDGARQGWHDKIAGTYVIDVSSAAQKEE